MNTLYKLILMSVAGLLFSNGLFADRFKNDKSNKKTNKLNSTKSITALCSPGFGSTYLELNNVRALIHTGGDMWWDLIGKAKYEIPKGSGKTALFAGSIWIGGTDINGQLKLAATKFREGVDYWPGPLITSGAAQATVTSDICSAYDRHFVINKSDVALFRSWYHSSPEIQAANFPNYQIPDIITNWPAHGPAGGYDNYLAPFFDNNNDGSYNPSDGDYPYFDLDNSLPCGTSRENRVPHLYGDQSLWWVFNDKGNLHTETNSDAIGLEIRAQAFAFATNDELNNTTFYNYAIINRSTYTLEETYIGVWTDADLGYAADDYVGCDVNKGLGYVYNGKPIDGAGQPEAYGGPTPPPPAIGIDFFEGPYQDADGMDNLSSWDNNEIISCTNGYRINKTTGVKILIGAGDILNGNINGLNFGDSIVDNERWGMSKFVYFNNGNDPQGDPQTAIQYYQYLKGYWKDGTHIIYGTTGYGATGMATNFMFPGLSDPCNWGTAGNTPTPSPTNPTLGWSEKGENMPPSDRRIVQSAGPFTLEPGAVNDITTGAVWARATSGDEYESVKLMQLADEKVQKLFESCFKSLNGPDAPELNIIEQDQKLVFHIYNLPGSNNYLEKYNQKDPLITCPLGTDGLPANCDKYFKFQGYQVFQLANQFVTATDLHDLSKTRLVYQCDILDNVKKLVNYNWSDELEANIPVMEVNGINTGINHSFTLTNDAFSTGDGKLVNNTKYYYIAIAYASNDFLHYNQNDPASFYGQKKPYKPSSKSYNFSGIRVFGLENDSIVPHLDTTSNNLTSIVYGDGFEITQIEGHGNGYNSVDLTDSTIAEIMAGFPWKALHPKYKSGRGPIKVKVIDPLNIPSDNYIIKMDSTEYHTDAAVGNNYKLNLIKKAKWNITNSSGQKIWSDQWIMVDDEMLIIEWGLSVKIQQVGYPFTKTNNPIAGYYSSSNILGPVNNNSFIEATSSNSNVSVQWLDFLQDNDASIYVQSGVKPENWIRSGFAIDPNSPRTNDYMYTVGSDAVCWDADQVYEKILGGTWSPYFLSSIHTFGPADSIALKATNYVGILGNGPGPIRPGISSVDVVITPDKSKWTRCAVLEMCEDPALSVGNAKKFDLRKSASKDRNGNSGTAEATANNTQPLGMSYFPGYAIDVETGERLNMMFGEDSWFAADHGNDMLWNPTSKKYSDLFYATGGSSGDVILGGKHYIYVMNNANYFKYIPALNIDSLGNYDEGKFIYSWLSSGNATKKKGIMACPMWTSIPIMGSGFNLLNGNTPLTELKYKIRIAKPYRKGYRKWAVDTNLAQNNNLPMYSFGTANILAPIANFSASVTTILIGGNVNFFDNSLNSRSSWKWTFYGGNPDFSTLQNPTNVIYNSLGTFSVKLAIYGSHGSDSITKTGYIKVDNITDLGKTDLSESVSIFPNPTDDKCTLAYKCTGSEQIKISVYNTNGKIIYKTEIQGQNILSRQIFLNNQASGIYLIKIETKHGSLFKKIIKN